MTKLDSNLTTVQLMNLDYKYSYTKSELNKDWERLCSVTQYKTGSQFRPGIKWCHHYMPHFFDIKDKRGKSFSSCWKDAEIMDKVLSWGKKGMSALWMSWIRRAVYMVGGLPNSSFYRPHFSKQIIELTGKNSGTLWDPCAGWGGRMLGTLASGWKYLACEPNEETYNKLEEMFEHLQAIDPELEEPTLINDGAEYITPNNIDVVLTSPPYFDLEIYSGEETQCYSKYESYESWRDGWLFPLIDTGINALNEGGLSCWNVMNSARTPNIVEDVVQYHQQKGYTLQQTIGFKSPLANIRDTKNKDVTYVFCQKGLDGGS